MRAADSDRERVRGRRAEDGRAGGGAPHGGARRVAARPRDAEQPSHGVLVGLRFAFNSVRGVRVLTCIQLTDDPSPVCCALLQCARASVRAWACVPVSTLFVCVRVAFVRSARVGSRSCARCQGVRHPA
eukprot:4045455-Pleurochrysis_carterae.AAC.1